MLIFYQICLVLYPDQTLVFCEQAVLHVKGLTGFCALQIFVHNAFEIFGVQYLSPKQGVTQKCSAWIAEQFFHLWAYVFGVGVFINTVNISGGGDVLKQGLILRLTSQCLFEKLLQISVVYGLQQKGEKEKK